MKRFGDDLLRVLRDPIVASVVAVGIVAIIGSAYSYLFAANRAVWGWFTVAAAAALAVGLLMLRYSRPSRRTLVFLSLGGTCRDPIAKAIMDELLDGTDLRPRPRVIAAGLGPISKPTASYAARYVINEMYGEDLLAHHKPVLLTSDIVEEASIILAMDASLIAAKKTLPSGHLLPSDKTYLLKKFFGEEGDVVDPWPDGSDDATLNRYRECAGELRRLLTTHFDDLIRKLRLAG